MHDSEMLSFGLHNAEISRSSSLQWEGNEQSATSSPEERLMQYPLEGVNDTLYGFNKKKNTLMLRWKGETDLQLHSRINLGSLRINLNKAITLTVQFR